MRCAVIKFAGTSGDLDCYHVCKSLLNWHVEYVNHYEDFSTDDFDLIILPGGASHGDYLRPGALAARSRVMKSVVDAAKAGRYVLGIGNGFQILAEAGILPGTFLINKDLKFVCTDVYLRVENNKTPFTALYKKGQVIRLKLACKYGCYYASEKVLQELRDGNNIVFSYCDENGSTSGECNPTGSLKNIAGIINKRGNVLGIMAHPERCTEDILGSTDGIKIFKSIMENEGGK